MQKINTEPVAKTNHHIFAKATIVLLGLGLFCFCSSHKNFLMAFHLKIILKSWASPMVCSTRLPLHDLILPLPPLCPLLWGHRAYTLPLGCATHVSTPGPLYPLLPLPEASLPQRAAGLPSSPPCSSITPAKRRPWSSYLTLALHITVYPRWSFISCQYLYLTDVVSHAVSLHWDIRSRESWDSICFVFSSVSRA